MAGVFRRPARPQLRRDSFYPSAPALYIVSINASQTASGTLSKAVMHGGLAGAQTATATCLKAVTKAEFSGVQNSTGAVTPHRVFLPGTPLGGSQTCVGSLNGKMFVHNATGSQTATGAVLKATTRKLAGAQTATATVTTAKFQIRSLSGAQAATGVVLKQTIRRFSGSLLSNGGTPKTAVRRFSSTFTPTGSVTPVRLPASGTWVSAPIPLPSSPLAGSLVVWTATVPASTTLTVETSVDNGATWQIIGNQQPIPHLTIGTTVMGSVMVRVSMTRTNYTIPTPSMTALNVRLSSDAGVSEYCPLGVFLIDDVAVTDSAAGAYVEISGSDMSRRIARNAWDTTYTVQPGTGYDEAIAAMVIDRMPDAELNFASTEQVTPQLQFGQSSSNDPWQDVQQMAQSIGYEVFFDARGVCTLRAVPDPDVAESQWEFEDIANPTITNLVRRVSDSNTFNKVIATGEGTGNDVPVQAIAIDDDPASPTYYLGAYGTVTYRFTSPLILTPDQAQAAADAMLRAVKGATEAVEIDVVPMPAIEPGDVVTVTRSRSKVEGRFLVDQLTTPLDPAETMHFTARRQRT